MSRGYFQIFIKNYTFRSISSIVASTHPPSPPKHCWSAPEIHGGTVKKNVSVTACTSPKNQHCVGGKGDEYCEKIKNLQGVPGLLASIVVSNN